MTEQNMYQQLAESIGAGDSKIVPEIMKKMADEKEAKVLLAASPPATTEELAEKTGFSKDEVQKMLDKLFHVGMIFKSKKENITRYYRVRHLLQFHDASIVTPDISKDILAMWKEFDHKEWPGYLDKMENAFHKAA